MSILLLPSPSPSPSPPTAFLRGTVETDRPLARRRRARDASVWLDLDPHPSSQRNQILRMMRGIPPCAGVVSVLNLGREDERKRGIKLLSGSCIYRALSKWWYKRVTFDEMATSSPYLNDKHGTSGETQGPKT